MNIMMSMGHEERVTGDDVLHIDFNMGLVPLPLHARRTFKASF
jgi:hypothetical protein